MISKKEKEALEGCLNESAELMRTLMEKMDEIAGTEVNGYSKFEEYSKEWDKLSHRIAGADAVLAILGYALVYPDLAAGRRHFQIRKMSRKMRRTEK